MIKPPRKLPKTASIAIPQGGHKLHAPSAARNVEPILQALAPVIPESGRALEIASGTGEHIVRYAKAFTSLQWQPTDIEPDRLASIDAWGAEAAITNLKQAQYLNASQPDWAHKWPKQDLIIFSNLLHLICDAEARTVLAEASQALASGGVLIIYGPFMRGENFASESDQSFHESLRGQDADIGYKPLHWVQGVLSDAGMETECPLEMPANNLLLIAGKL